MCFLWYLSSMCWKTTLKPLKTDWDGVCWVSFQLWYSNSFFLSFGGNHVVCVTQPIFRVWERLRTFSLLYSSASVIAVGRIFSQADTLEALCLWGCTLRHKLLMVKTEPSFDTWYFSNLQNHHSHSGDWSCGKQMRGFTTVELWHLVWMSKEPGNACNSSFSPPFFYLSWLLRVLCTWWLLGSLLSWM